MALKIDIKFERKLTCASKNDMKNFANFHQSVIRKSEKLNFYWVFLSKIENVWAYNLQKSYVSWKWRMMQKLKKTWLVNSKLTGRTCWFFTRALENLKYLHFNGLLLTKVYNVWTKKSTEELFLIALQIDAKFEGKLASTF